MAGHGRAASTRSYDPDVVPLLEWLEERAVAWVQDYDHNRVGIRGWLALTNAGCGLKVWPNTDRFTMRPLFEAIEAAGVEAVHRVLTGNHPWRPATIRAVAQIAAGRGRGVLWGWDLTSNG